MKRSQAVSLVLLGGAAVAAIAIAEHDPSQDEEDILVYPNAQGCIAAGLRSEQDCRSDYETARRSYAASVPRYDSMNGCEDHHGAGHCVGGGSVSQSLRDSFVPLMAAYMVGRTAQQALTAQPLYDHAPKNEGTSSSSGGGFYGGYGGYCTSSGGRVVTASGGRASSARVSSAVARGTSFGGFGGTGRSFASTGESAGRSGFGG